MTGPGIFYQADLDAGEQLTRIAPNSTRSQVNSSVSIIAALVVSALGIVWTVGTVVLGVRDALDESIIQTIHGPNTTPAGQMW